MFLLCLVGAGPLLAAALFEEAIGRPVGVSKYMRLVWLRARCPP